MEIPPGLPDTTNVADDFSALIDEELSRRGYSVIRPQKYTAAWARVATDMGDFRILGSEERDEAKLSRGDGPHDGDRSARISSWTRSSSPASSSWKRSSARGERCGTAPSRRSKRRARWRASSRDRSAASSGLLSLKLSIRDREGITLFIHNGGIQVLSKMEGKAFVNVPREELFTDKERNRRAVEIAIEPLKR